mmetsp:Transcript_11601/g.31589  ORF Transcript_11601/g.31589 Transcript_11601/m.31589 type:complete len:497 (-) Transcript_11601:799-2289(-)
MGREVCQELLMVHGVSRDLQQARPGNQGLHVCWRQPPGQARRIILLFKPCGQPSWAELMAIQDWAASHHAGHLGGCHDRSAGREGGQGGQVLLHVLHGCRAVVDAASIVVGPQATAARPHRRLCLQLRLLLGLHDSTGRCCQSAAAAATAMRPHGAVQLLLLLLQAQTLWCLHTIAALPLRGRCLCRDCCSHPRLWWPLCRHADRRRHKGRGRGGGVRLALCKHCRVAAWRLGHDEGFTRLSNGSSRPPTALAFVLLAPAPAAAACLPAAAVFLGAAAAGGAVASQDVGLDQQVRRAAQALEGRSGLLRAAGHDGGHREQREQGVFTERQRTTEGHVNGMHAGGLGEAEVRKRHLMHRHLLLRCQGLGLQALPLADIPRGGRSAVKRIHGLVACIQGMLPVTAGLHHGAVRGWCMAIATSFCAGLGPCWVGACSVTAADTPGLLTWPCCGFLNRAAAAAVLGSTELRHRSTGLRAGLDNVALDHFSFQGCVRQLHN